jgi:hypothetical protein
MRLRPRISWLIGAAVVALLIVAGVDALRSSGGEPSASATTSTTAAEVTLPRCAPGQTEVTLEFRGRVATNVVRHVSGGECVLPYLQLEMTIEDHAGIPIFQSRRPSALWGLLPPGAEQDFDFPIPDSVLECAEGGPFRARVTVASYSAQREVSANEIGCADANPTPGSADALTRGEYIARAEAICTTARAALDSAEANLDLDWDHLDDQEAAWIKAAARAMRRAQTALQALTPPKRYRADMNRLLSFMARQIEVHRKSVEALSAGDIRRALPLLDQSLALEREKNRLVLDPDLNAFSLCP